MSERLRVHLALATVQVLFGLWPVAGSVLLRVMPPAALIGFRLALGAPILALAAGLPWRRPPGPRVLLGLAVAAALGIGVNQLLFAEGLARSDPVNASVAILLLPSFTLLIATVAGRERPGARRLFGAAVALAGGAVLVGVERLDLSDRAVVGNLLLLANVTAYAAFLVMARPLFLETGALPGMAWAFLLGALEALPFTLGPTLAVPWLDLSPALLGLLGFVLVGPTLATYLLNAWALRRVESSLVALYTNVQPVVASLGALVFLGTAPSPRSLGAAAIIVVGVAIASYAPRGAAAAP